MSAPGPSGAPRDAEERTSTSSPAVKQMEGSVRALRLEVPEAIHADVRAKWEAVKSEREALLDVAETAQAFLDYSNRARRGTPDPEEWYIESEHLARVLKKLPQDHSNA